jgi:hypothetical protein
MSIWNEKYQIKKHKMIEYEFYYNIRIDSGDPSLPLRMTGSCRIREGKRSGDSMKNI